MNVNKCTPNGPSTLASASLVCLTIALVQNSYSSVILFLASFISRLFECARVNSVEILCTHFTQVPSLSSSSWSKREETISLARALLNFTLFINKWSFIIAGLLNNKNN